MLSFFNQRFFAQYVFNAHTVFFSNNSTVFDKMLFGLLLSNRKIHEMHLLLAKQANKKLSNLTVLTLLYSTVRKLSM